MATVSLQNVTKTYGDVVAVSDFSLLIGHGEFVALLGPSGCGKTTTLQMLAGFVEATSGDIRIDGTSMRGIPPHKRNIGVVFQSYALFPHLTVFGNVGFGLKMRDVERTQLTERVHRALGLVQLTGLDARYPRELSGGQQQRVALARALVIEPSVLLLDEPLSNLDANLREQMRFEIREIQKRIGITTVFVTHDQNEAMAAADRLVVMSKGAIRQVGTAQEIYEQPSDMFVASFIGQANLLRCTVTAVRGSEADVALPAGDSIIVRHDGTAKAGDARHIALRPEDFELGSEQKPGVNNVRGTVTRVNYLGASINAGVRVGDANLIVSIPRGRGTAREGEQVYVRWPKFAGIMLAGTN